MDRAWAAILTDRQLRAWRIRGLSVGRIAELCGARESEIAARISGLWREAQSRSECEDEAGRAPHDAEELESMSSLRLAPTIAAAAAAIQSEWSPAEERLRRAVRHAPVELMEFPDVRRTSHC